MSLLVRPTTPPLWLGVVVAAFFIAAESGLVYLLERLAPENTFGAVFLLGVLVVSARWGFGLAVATTLASALVYVYFHLQTEGSFLPTKVQDLVAIVDFPARRAVGQHSRGPGPTAHRRGRTTPQRSRGKPR